MIKKLDIDRYAIGQINMLANRLITKFSEAYQTQFGVGIMEWRVIAILYDHPHSSLQYISDIVGLDKAAVSRSLKKLAEKKLVIIKEDSVDKRAYKLKLSKKGENLYAQISEFSLQKNDELLNGLSEHEISEFFRLISFMKVKADQLFK